MTQTLTAQPSSPGSRRRGPAVLAALALGLVVGVLITIAVLALSGDGAGDDPLEGRIDPARHQAVILTNDKVYFGRIRNAGGEFFELRDAYFVRETAATDAGPGERQVLPISREIHTPDTRMLIRKDEVVLVEDLSRQSAVLREIRRQER